MGQTSEAVRQSVRLIITDSEGEGDGDAKVIPVLGRRFLIGRAASCQLRPMNPLVSRQHAAIEDEGDGDFVVLRDLGSRNGTFRNDRRVTAPIRLRDGDRVQIGPMTFTVSIQPVEDAQDEPSSTEDQVASWLIGASGMPSADSEPDASNSGGVTHIGDPRPEKRRSMRPL